MASAPQPSLPLFYRELVPLSSQQHGDHRLRRADTAPFLTSANAIPITSDEFLSAQRSYPIVFSSGENPVPLALMGLQEGTNVFVDADGKVDAGVYLPAYARRYPFMLARLRPDSEDLSLCFDPSSGLIGSFDEGEALFDGDQPSRQTHEVLNFCQDFEMSVQKTSAFMKELADHKLLMDGELTIQVTGSEQPHVFRGFQMVDEEKLRDLRGDVLRKFAQSGALPLLYAHLMSLPLARDVFAKGVERGFTPLPTTA